VMVLPAKKSLARAGVVVSAKASASRIQRIIPSSLVCSKRT
jgi:hypothetical protein